MNSVKASVTAEISSMDELFFIEKSICDIIVPEASEIDLEAALRTSDANEKGEQPSLVPSIAQRQTLFFGKLPRIGGSHNSNVLLIPDM